MALSDDLQDVADRLIAPDKHCGIEIDVASRRRRTQDVARRPEQGRAAWIAHRDSVGGVARDASMTTFARSTSVVTPSSPAGSRRAIEPSDWYAGPLATGAVSYDGDVSSA